MNQAKDIQAKQTPLFIYWHQGWEKAPEVVQACRDSWLKHHLPKSQFEVVLLCNHTIRGWLADCSESDRERLEFFKQRLENSTTAGSLAFYTDYLRLVLTETHGGFWIDATVYCLHALERWVIDSTTCLMPLSISPDRLYEVWFIDNRAQDPLISEWKKQLATPHFAIKSYTKYRDDWTTKPHMISHWLFKLSRRSWIFSGFIWNSTLTKRWLRIRPYFMVNYALHKVISSKSHFKNRHTYILPVDVNAMVSLELFEQIRSHKEGQQLLSRVPFIKLSHKKKWNQDNPHGINMKNLLASLEGNQSL